MTTGARQLDTLQPRTAVVPVTVVIPGYDAERFLEEAYRSASGQTARPAEIIVVDDGSTDGTAALAERLGAKVVRQPHLGLSAARNAGIRAASQPWIALLDADDLWEPEKLERQWIAVEQCPDVGLVFTDFLEFSSRGVLVESFLSRRKNYPGVERIEVAPGVLRCGEDSLRRQFLKGNFIAPSTLLVRRDLLVQVGLFDTTLSHMEDRELWLRLLAVSRAAVVERPLMRSRIHDSNMSRDTLKMILSAALIGDRVLAHPDRYPAGAAEHYRKEQPDLYLNAGRFADEGGETARARQYYLTSWRLGGGLRPLALAALSLFPRPVRARVRAAYRALAKSPEDGTTADNRAASPSTVLFIENSRGLGGSTVSLCNLLLHLDRSAYRPVVAFSRPEQQAYVLAHCEAPLISTVIPVRKSLGLSRALRVGITRLAHAAPALGRPFLAGPALLEHLALTLPYFLRLRSFARAHHIHCIQHNNGFDLAAILLAWSLRVPLIVYQRGNEWNSPTVRYLSRRVDMFVANSEATRQSLLAIGIPPERTRVIYPPVDFARFDFGLSCATQRREFRVGDSERCFGIIGSLVERKGHRVFLKATARVLRALPSARAFIIGEAAPRAAAYERELAALARELGIADRVAFTGFRNDVNQLIQLLDVVVHASVEPEPFGRVIVEAMAMKKPVIASGAGGPLEIIEHGHNGFLTPPGDDGQLAAHILKLLTDTELATKIANRGYLDAKARFSVSAHVALMQALYAELLTAAQPRAPLGRAPQQVGP